MYLTGSLLSRVTPVRSFKIVQESGVFTHCCPSTWSTWTSVVSYINYICRAWAAQPWLSSLCVAPCARSPACFFCMVAQAKALRWLLLQVTKHFSRHHLPPPSLPVTRAPPLLPRAQCQLHLHRLWWHHLLVMQQAVAASNSRHAAKPTTLFGQG